MEISFVNKNKAVQPQQVHEQTSDPARNVSTEENKKYTLKNKVDSAEISSGYSGAYSDKRITVAKSSVLYDVSVGTGSSARVQELKQAIKEGTYEIPSNLLAESILRP